jgi:hypothetical protein
MDLRVFNELHEEGFISDSSLATIIQTENKRLFSVRWELTSLLSLGILLLTTGLGILVYKNINHIGHLAVISFITLASIACLYYCFGKAFRPTRQQVPAPNVWFDYVLLLGSLLFVTFIGYLQYQYQAFGNSWNLATLITALFLFFFAYYFDNIAVLSLAITTLAAWVGISVAPIQLLRNIDLSDTGLIQSLTIFGLALLLLAELLTRQNIKAHFYNTYKNFALHLLFIGLCSGIIAFRHFYLLWFAALVAVAAYQYRQSLKHNSFYYLLISTLYFYFGLSATIIISLWNLGNNGNGEAFLGLLLMYLIASTFGLIVFLVHHGKLIRNK